MRLGSIEVIEPYPAIYIKELEAIVICDLHLGYEGIMAEQGIFMPKVQFEREMEILSKIVDYKSASNFIIVGDVKHEFSETTYHEFREVKDLFEYLKNNFERIVLVKGNHDNYIIYTTRRYGVELYDEFLFKDFLFLHGDKPLKETKGRYIIMGHEHPAIALYDEIGAKEKLKCFLYGEVEARKFLVMPAFSYLALGSEVNTIPREELLSPILKELEIDDFRVIAISEEAGIMDFGRLGDIRPEKLF
jgi:hypothetical protein